MHLASHKLSKTSMRILLGSAKWATSLTWSTSKRLLLSISIVALLTSLVPAALALTIRNLINAISASLATGEADIAPIMFWIGCGLGISVVDTVGGFAIKYFSGRLQDELNLRITTDILEHAATLDVSFFENSSFQDIIERTQQNAAERFSQFVDKTLRVLANLIQMASLVAVLAAIEPLVALVLGVVAVPYLLFQWRLAKTRYAMEFRRITKQRWTRYYVTQLTSQHWVPEVKLLGIAPILISKFRNLMSEFRDENQNVNRRIYRGSSLYASISSVAFYVTFAIVALRVLRGGLTIGDLAIYGGAMARLRSTLETTVLDLTSALEQTIHITNLREFFGLQNQAHPSAGTELPATSGGAISVKNAWFTYPGSRKPVLRDINLHIRAGETVALVGKNGAGKTTLVKLIARLYELDEGQILLDDTDIRRIPIDYLHQQVSFVFQRFGRYETTVAENIAYGDWQKLLGDLEGVKRIAREADVDQMIERMPEGYDTLLGRMFGDHTLSSGQWQKIAIARAFARDASLLILDEPTSNLDAEAEYRLFSRFRDLARGRTTILVSHRFSTVGMADRILVMDGGSIAESGTHAELLARNGRYAKLYDMHQRQTALLQ